MTTSYSRGNKHAPTACCWVQSEKGEPLFQQQHWPTVVPELQLPLGKDSFSSSESSDDQQSCQHPNQDQILSLVLMNGCIWEIPGSQKHFPMKCRSRVWDAYTFRAGEIQQEEGIWTTTTKKSLQFIHSTWNAAQQEKKRGMETEIGEGLPCCFVGWVFFWMIFYCSHKFCTLQHQKQWQDTGFSIRITCLILEMHLPTCSALADFIL